PGRPRPGASLVPRAETTSVSGHGSAAADGATAREAAAQTRVDVIAANRADIRSEVTPVIFTYLDQLRPTVCPGCRFLTGASGHDAPATFAVRSPRRASARPPSTTTPPTAWMGVIASPSNSQAA